jgi:hypothetical protein
MGDGRSDKLKNWLQLFLAICGAIGVVWGFLSSLSNNIVTDSKLQEHNINEKSHPFIISSTKECEGKVEALSKRIEESHDTEVALGARLVRLLASDMETNRNLKAASASYYEQEFRHKIRKGMSIEEAILESLRSPFYSRPRGQ